MSENDLADRYNIRRIADKYLTELLRLAVASTSMLRRRSVILRIQQRSYQCRGRLSAYSNGRLAARHCDGAVVGAIPLFRRRSRHYDSDR